MSLRLVSFEAAFEVQQRTVMQMEADRETVDRDQEGEAA